MNLGSFLTNKLLSTIEKNVKKKPPNVVIGTDYLKRWHIIPENKFFNIYYHEVNRSDLDRHLHDHPYFFCSIILDGGYIEHQDRIMSRRLIKGDINFKLPRTLHRLELDKKGYAKTLFITGPKIRLWGFQTENGWMESREYFKVYGEQI